MAKLSSPNVYVFRSWAINLIVRFFATAIQTLASLLQIFFNRIFFVGLSHLIYLILKCWPISAYFIYEIPPRFRVLWMDLENRRINTRPDIPLYTGSFSWLEKAQSIQIPNGRNVDLKKLGDIYRTGRLVCTQSITSPSHVSSSSAISFISRWKFAAFSGFTGAGRSCCVLGNLILGQLQIC